MREIPPVSAKLKALQDAMTAQMERKQRAQEKVAQHEIKKEPIAELSQPKYVPSVEDKYLMAQFKSGRYCGD